MGTTLPLYVLEEIIVGSIDFNQNLTFPNIRQNNKTKDKFLEATFQGLSVISVSLGL